MVCQKITPLDRKIVSAKNQKRLFCYISWWFYHNEEFAENLHHSSNLGKNSIFKHFRYINEMSSHCSLCSTSTPPPNPKSLYQYFCHFLLMLIPCISIQKLLSNFFSFARPSTNFAYLNVLFCWVIATDAKFLNLNESS